MYRKGVGLMLLNKEGHVFVAKRAGAHKTKLNTWQMPQGGIEEGEEEIEALYRESFEEISLQKDEFTILTKTKELLRYDIPAEVPTLWDKAKYKGQEQRWFLGLLKDHNYNSEIKTCVLISGQVRDNFYQCIMSQKIFLFDPLNVDIFAVFSDDIDDDTKEYVIKLLKPKGILWIKDSKIINNKLSLPLSCYPMTRKILLCNNLKIKYEKKNNFIYDINIRSRIDLIIKA
jgi:8-oxo-dGTP pyrophosphatase MutT (NUDIX family)